jgi:PAS domain S-box-containing protein
MDLRVTPATPNLSARIRRSRDSVCRDWLAVVRARVPGAKDKQASLVINSLPECLGLIAELLAGEASARFRLRELGKEHGEQRCRLGGFSLDQILLEHTLLREVLLGLLQRDGPLPWPEQQALMAAIDELASSSSVEFTRLEHSRLQAETTPHVTGLRALTDSLPDGILLVDRQWRIAYVNNAALRMLYGDSERVPRMLLGKPLWEDPPTLGSSRVLKSQIDAMEKDRSAEFVEHVPELGLWLQVSVTSGPQGFVTFFRDITATRRAEEALHNTQTSFGLMVQRVKDYAIFMLDAEGRVSSWNEGAERIKGYKAEEIVGQHFRRLYLPEDAAAGRPEHNLQKARLCGAAVDEWWRARKDGTTFWATVTITAMYDSEGKLQGYAKVLKDLTERKRVEEQQRFLANAGTVLSTTLNSDENLQKLARILVPAFASWCVLHVREPGRSETPLVMHHEKPESQRLLEELARYHPDFLELPGGPRKALRTGQPVLAQRMDTTTLKAFCKDERHLELLQELGIEKYVSVPLMAHGATVGALTLVSSSEVREYDHDFLSFIEDVANRAAMAIDNTRLYRQTERSVKLREQLVAVVSHDLRNPLTAIGTASATLKRIPDLGEKTPLIHRQADIIGRSMERMNRLMSDLLDAARIEAEGLPISPQEMALTELMDEVCDAFEQVAHERSIQLVVDRDPRDCRVFVDRDRIAQVFSNLIGNALKFTPAGGKVSVLVEECGEEARFCVKDTGPGIQEADLPHLFDAYWQSEHTKGSGAGLGLAIAKGIVEAHGGRIWVESTPGEGAAFYFVVPRSGRPTEGTETTRPGGAFH